MYLKSSLALTGVMVSLLMPLPALSESVVVEKDPMQPFIRLRLDPSDQPYLIRAKVFRDRKNVQIYVVHSYRGDANYHSASVKWVDGSLKNPKLYDVDTDYDCSYSRYGGGCLKTIHKVIRIKPESWKTLAQWANTQPSASLPFQLQSNQVGEVFNFNLNASDVKTFNTELVKH